MFRSPRDKSISIRKSAVCNLTIGCSSNSDVKISPAGPEMAVRCLWQCGRLQKAVKRQLAHLQLIISYITIARSGKVAQLYTTQPTPKHVHALL